MRGEREVCGGAGERKIEREKETEDKGVREKEVEEVTLARNSGGGGRRKEPRIDEDSDGN